jgi:hypothetical protein
MRIDELFEKYPNNIIGFRVNKTTKIIDFWLNDTWELKETSNAVAIKKQKDDEQNQRAYYIIYGDSVDFDLLFNELSSIIEYNLDIERKQQLFTKKMDELKNLFITLPYDDLKKLTFDTALIDPTTMPSDNLTLTNSDFTAVNETKNNNTKDKKTSKKQKIVSDKLLDEDDYMESDIIEGDVSNIKPVNLN